MRFSTDMVWLNIYNNCGSNSLPINGLNFSYLYCSSVYNFILFRLHDSVIWPWNNKVQHFLLELVMVVGLQGVSGVANHKLVMHLDIHIWFCFFSVDRVHNFGTSMLRSELFQVTALSFLLYHVKQVHLHSCVKFRKWSTACRMNYYKEMISIWCPLLCYLNQRDACWFFWSSLKKVLLATFLLVPVILMLSTGHLHKVLIDSRRTRDVVRWPGTLKKIGIPKGIL